MASTNDLEATIGGWYKAMNLPHLPKNGQKWLADNAWWLALVGAILGVLAFLAIVPLLLTAISLTSVVAFAVAYPSLFWLGALISVVSYVITTVLLFMSVNPLKAKAKRGWRLLFLAYLINFSLAIVSNLVELNIGGAIISLVFAAITGYFMYEIYGYFGAHHKVDAKKAHHAKA